jgi:hypothetical protein
MGPELPELERVLRTGGEEIFRVEEERANGKEHIAKLVANARKKARALHLGHVHTLDDQWTFAGGFSIPRHPLPREFEIAA